MENASGESGDENGEQRNLFLRRAASAQEKGENYEQSEHQSRKQRMTKGAIEGEKRGGASKFAERVEVGDGSRDQYDDGDGASDVGERGAIQGVGGQGVVEGIHW